MKKVKAFAAITLFFFVLSASSLILNYFNVIELEQDSYFTAIILLIVSAIGEAVLLINWCIEKFKSEIIN